jgi:hypothetical protein
VIDWLHYLRRWVGRKASGGQRRERTSRPRPFRLQPLIEELEGRRVPASLNLSLDDTMATDWLIRLNGGVVEVLANDVVQDTIAAGTGNDITINGEMDEDDTLTVDFSDGFFLLDAILFNGGTGSSDELFVIGTGTTTGVYKPSLTDFGDGQVDVTSGANTTDINFTGLEPVEVSAMATFTFETQGGEDDLEVNDTMGSGGEDANVITGTSDSIMIEALTFFDIETFIIDTAANDTGGMEDDTVEISAAGLVAQGLKNFTVMTGDGADTLIINTNEFRLPVTGGTFKFDGGADQDTITAMATETTPWTMRPCGAPAGA